MGRSRLEPRDPRDPEFAGRLRLARRRAGLTRQQLAEAAGISRRAVAEYEQGRVPPYALPKLARALEVSTVWLLTGEQSTDARLRELLERLDHVIEILERNDARSAERTGVLERVEAALRRLEERDG